MFCPQYGLCILFESIYQQSRALLCATINEEPRTVKWKTMDYRVINEQRKMSEIIEFLRKIEIK